MVEGVDLDPKSFMSKEKKLEMKVGTQSETIDSGKPCSLKMFMRKDLASSDESVDSSIGMK